MKLKDFPDKDITFNEKDGRIDNFYFQGQKLELHKNNKTEENDFYGTYRVPPKYVFTKLKKITKDDILNSVQIKGHSDDLITFQIQGCDMGDVLLIIYLKGKTYSFFYQPFLLNEKFENQTVDSGIQLSSIEGNEIIVRQNKGLRRNVDVNFIARGEKHLIESFEVDLNDKVTLANVIEYEKMNGRQTVINAIKILNERRKEIK